MPEKQRNQIKADIRLQGQVAERLVFLPDTPSLTESLIQIAPNFFLGSYPLGSGKAAIEAMSAGVPVIIPRPPTTLPLIGADMSLGAGIILKTLEEIPAAMSRLRAEGATMARHSREIFDRHYCFAAFRAMLLSLTQ